MWKSQDQLFVRVAIGVIWKLDLDHVQYQEYCTWCNSKTRLRLKV